MKHQIIQFFRGLTRTRGFDDRTLYDRVLARYAIQAAPSRTPLRHRPPPVQAVHPLQLAVATRSTVTLLVRLQARYDVTRGGTGAAALRKPPTLSTLLRQEGAHNALMDALWSIFNSNNLNLRHSMVRLSTAVRRAEPERTVERSILMLRQLLLPPIQSVGAPLRHPAPPEQGATAQAVPQTAALERLVEQKLQQIQAAPAAQPDLDALCKKIGRQLEREQQEQWRCEKLKRGLL